MYAMVWKMLAKYANNYLSTNGDERLGMNLHDFGIHLDWKSFWSYKHFLETWTYTKRKSNAISQQNGFPKFVLL